MIVSLCALPSMPLSLLFNSNVCSNLKSSFRMSLAFLPRSLYFGGAMSAHPNKIPHQRYMHRHPKTNTRTVHCQEPHANSGKRLTTRDPHAPEEPCTGLLLHHSRSPVRTLNQLCFGSRKHCWHAVRCGGTCDRTGTSMPGGCASSLHPASASCPCA